MPTGNCIAWNCYKAVGELVQHVRVFRPHIMLTFGPEGGVTGHTDHTMASVFATWPTSGQDGTIAIADQLIDGVEAHRVQKLYYATENFVLAGRPRISPPPITTVIEIGDTCGDEDRSL